MGQKLSRDEYMSSMEALKKFYFSCDRINGPHNLLISVINSKTKDIELELNVKITIVYDNMGQKINILWEDSGIKNFRDLGLFGVYWALYNTMEFDDDENVLSIYSSDSNKIVKVYS